MTKKARAGFTLIELFVVIVIIGILAGLAIPKFMATKQKAYMVAAEEDLRNLVTAEAAYFATYSTYTSNTTAMNATQTPGVTISVDNVTGQGWSATATHTELVGATPDGCHVAVGPAETTSSENEGAPYCP
jgi:prepilin-type N-terminal cleavage/methylation domain-containing protein